MSLSVESPANTGPVEDFTERLQHAWRQVWEFLEAERAGRAHWKGELSTSALSTATAVSALHQYRQAEPEDAAKSEIDQAIAVGCRWLATQQNTDGGFGDTSRSHSNIATTYLVLAAWKMSGFHGQAAKQESQAWGYVKNQGEWQGLRQRYGKDKTFVVPILSNCALAGLVPWRKVPALPFEAAWLPQDWYRLARMPVVSYAIPALVAIGQARHHFAPSRNPLLKMLRQRAVKPTLEVLRNMQPESGGYLEATPLTSFVLMNLAAAGKSRLAVCQDCLKFLLASRLEDGSWPIDTNLATWVTNLAWVALSKRSGKLNVALNHSGASGKPVHHGDVEPRAELGSEEVGLAPKVTVASESVRWILRCQHKGRHPFTGAQPGGWGWTDLSGAVPDSDDTPAALLALSKLTLCEMEHFRLHQEVLVAAGRGLGWLLKLQNRDGGWPTFCRGWGKLPFDRSGTDLTAHALRALHAWTPRLTDIHAADVRWPQVRDIERASERGLRFLKKTQQADGSWLPLWFGNQDRNMEDNPVYGTSKVVLALAEIGMSSLSMSQRGIEFLHASQNADGGWGGGLSVNYPDSALRSPDLAHPPAKGGSTVEETALAVEALLARGGNTCKEATIIRGLSWLLRAIDRGWLETAWPIGFYFAKLWYYERLYPAIFSLGALGAALANEGPEPSATQRVKQTKL